jgi:arylsulfatase A-like enzyme
MIENLDENIGRLMDTLNRSPVFRENTLVVYFSDHGDFMGSHDAFCRKSHPQEESIRIPAIFHWPEHIPAQGKRNDLFSLVDLLPTTLGLLGPEIPSHIQGIDFAPALRGDAFEGPDAVLLEMHGNPRWNLDFLDWRGLVTDRWKYAYYETGHQLLFDLEQDPYEQDNIAATDTGTCERLRRQLLQMLSEAREPYFDVLIEYGTHPESPVVDVSNSETACLSPTWQDMIQKSDR